MKNHRFCIFRLGENPKTGDPQWQYWTRDSESKKTLLVTPATEPNSSNGHYACRTNEGVVVYENDRLIIRQVDIVEDLPVLSGLRFEVGHHDRTGEEQLECVRRPGGTTVKYVVDRRCRWAEPGRAYTCAKTKVLAVVKGKFALNLVTPVFEEDRDGNPVKKSDKKDAVA